MPYIVFCLDRPDAGDLRKKTRPAHLEYTIAHRHLVHYGWPMQTEDATRVKCSVMALDFDSRAEVEAFLAQEPYSAAGLFDEIRIERMVQMVPERIPGLLESELVKERAST